jgi:predicted MFS family arabinose efflux permease
VFLLLSVADCLAVLALYIPYTYLPSAAAGLPGAPPALGATALSLAGAANTAGRVLAGWMADQARPHPLLLATAAISCAAPCLLIIPLYPALPSSHAGTSNQRNAIQPPPGPPAPSCSSCWPSCSGY